MTKLVKMCNCDNALIYTGMIKGQVVFLCPECRGIFCFERKETTRMCRDCECCDEHMYCSSLDLKLCSPYVGDCSHYKERKEEMNIKEAYKVLQKEWVKLYNVEIGDTVEILREMESDELGCRGAYSCQTAGNESEIYKISANCIRIVPGGQFPFFCLKLVKKAEPKIEIDIKINGKPAKLSDVSEETLRNIRKGEN